MANTQPAAAVDIPKAVRRLEDKIDNLPARAELHRAVRIRTGAAAGGAIIAVIAPS